MLNDMAPCEELFHTAAGSAFADITVDDHRETWPIRSKRFAAGCGAAITRRPGAPRAQRRFAQPSIYSRPGRNSTVPSVPSTSASASKPATSISISLMSAGAASTSDPMVGG
jgi:hypothetical protein